MTRRRPQTVTAALILGCVLLTPSTVSAQPDKLDILLPSLFAERLRVNEGALRGVFPGLVVDGRTVNFQQILDDQITSTFTMNSLIAAQVSSFPLGSSAGGFSWTFDPALGTFNRVSDSFGPVFAERALTAGKGRLNLSASYQRATFDRLQGKDLQSGEIVQYTGFLLPSSVAGPTRSAFFEDRLALKLTTDIVAISGAYGATDRLDVGVVVPIVKVDMEARLDFRAGVNGTFGSAAPILGKTVAGNASGVGDLVARAKYNIVKRPGGGVAAGVDWRLPTGDDENLLGTGMQAKMYAAVSAQAQRLSPHVNFGYTVSKEASAHTENEPDQINFAGGADVAVTPRLTVVGDLVGRTLRDTAFLDYQPSQFGGSFQQFTTDYGNLNLLLGSAGVKFNPGGKGLVSFSVLFPLNDNGLQDKLTWMGGVEFSF